VDSEIFNYKSITKTTNQSFVLFVIKFVDSYSKGFIHEKNISTAQQTKNQGSRISWKNENRRGAEGFKKKTRKRQKKISRHNSKIMRKYVSQKISFKS